MLGISDAAERIGFRTMGVKITLEQLRTEVPLPCVLQRNPNWRVVGAAPSWRKKIQVLLRHDRSVPVAFQAWGIYFPPSGIRMKKQPQ